MAITYDIAIIGMGCAGSHVALELLKRAPHLQVAILDDYQHMQEKTWSFWEKEASSWDHITTSWNTALVHTGHHQLVLPLDPYQYKSVKNVDFIAFAKAKLQNNPNFHFYHKQVLRTELKTTINNTKKQHIYHNDGEIIANIVLDSSNTTTALNGVTLLQHFKGWVIETQKDHFDPSAYTMMDFRLVAPGTTSFTYVLPYSRRTALIEFTYFSPKRVESSVYDQYLKQYIKDILQIASYDIKDIEYGVIPMSTHDFTSYNNKLYYKIGTAGGWVKASTGYSFKNSQRLAAQLVDNILNNKSLNHKMSSKKHELYDQTLLRVLHDYNSLGPSIFSKMYSRNRIQTIFSFLDQESRFINEIQIMNSLKSKKIIASFIKSLGNLIGI